MQLEGNARNVLYAAGLFQMLKTGSDSIIGPITMRMIARPSKVPWAICLQVEFPGIFGPLISQLFADKIDEMYARFHPPSKNFTIGQMLWVGVAAEILRPATDASRTPTSSRSFLIW